MKSQAGSVAGWRVLFELLQVLPRLPLAEQGLTTLAAGEGAHLHSDDQPTGLRALESGATSARDDGKNVHVGPCPEVAAGGATGERNSRTLRPRRSSTHWRPVMRDGLQCLGTDDLLACQHMLAEVVLSWPVLPPPLLLAGPRFSVMLQH